MASSDAKKVQYSYKGVNYIENKEVSGTIFAKDEKEAKFLLYNRKILVKELKRYRAPRSKKIKNKNITVFARQLATMIESGIPLTKSLAIIAEGNQDNKSLSNLILNIKSDIEQGLSFTDSLRKNPKYFDSLFCGLVEAGEKAGTLDIMLNNIASYRERILAIKRKIVGALIYPVIVITTAIIIVICMLLFIIPKFQEFYAGFGAKLPTITLILLSISSFFQKYLLFILIFVFVTIFLFVYSYINSISLKKKCESFLLKIPIFGDLVLKSTIVRWSRTLSILIKAGIPLVESLKFVASACGNLVYLDSTNIIRAKVSQGQTLTGAMQDEKIYPGMFMQMVIVGEESGSLDSMLEKAAAYYEEEVDNLVNILSILLEPFIIIFLAFIVIIILLALYLPLFNIGSVL